MISQTALQGSGSGGPYAPAPLRVLLVSDDPAECAQIRALFDDGIRARTSLGQIALDSAGDYRQATILARDFDYAAVLLGRAGGLPLLRRAAVERDLPGPFLLLADEVGTLEAAEAMSAGAADILAKSGLTPLLLERAVRYAVALHAAQNRAAGLELFDVATGLPRQPLFWEVLSLAVRRARRNKDFLAVLMLHLDCLETPSGQPGVDPLQAVMPLVSQRLQRILRASDTIARLDNGHLAVLVESMPRAEDIQTVAEKIIAAGKGQYETAGRLLNLTLNVGIALYPTSAHEAGELLQAAASATLAARDKGIDEFHFG